jgi:hypothetical protein
MGQMTCSTPIPHGNNMPMDPMNMSNNVMSPRGASRTGNCNTPHGNAGGAMPCGNNSTMEPMVPKEETPLSPCYGSNPNSKSCNNNNNNTNNMNNNNNNNNNSGANGQRQANPGMGAMNMTPQQFMMQMQTMAGGWNQGFMTALINGENGSDTGDDNRWKIVMVFKIKKILDILYMRQNSSKRADDLDKSAFNLWLPASSDFKSRKYSLRLI